MPSKRNFKRREVPAADILEWAVARHRQQFIVIVAIVVVALGLALGLLINLERRPALPGWPTGPSAYTAAMSDRQESQTLVALYLSQHGCGACNTFERQYLRDPRVKRFLANFDLVHIDVSADASSSAIAALYQVDRYPAFVILRPPPKPARQVHLFTPEQTWLPVPAFVDACKHALTWPDQVKGGVRGTIDTF